MVGKFTSDICWLKRKHGLRSVFFTLIVFRVPGVTNLKKLKKKTQKANLREWDRKGKSLPQVHTHEGHISYAIDCRRTPENLEGF